MAVLLVADFEALFYQDTTTLETSNAAQTRTLQAISYTAWLMLFYCLHISVIDLF
jgi:hypothetical protein